MNRLIGVPSWDDVLMLDRNTQAEAGPSGILTAQTQALVNRLEYLKTQLEALNPNPQPSPSTPKRLQFNEGGEDALVEVIVEPENFSGAYLNILGGTFTIILPSGRDVTSDELVYTFYIVNEASGHITWPESLFWTQGVKPSPSNLTCIIQLRSYDNGNTWIAFELALDAQPLP